ncbi:DUF169 domain-containing protein [Alloacidobacterium dinghuense]|uniref:DUF169 domain-containing protein n=1 Tax=Alloacidobacterium dinghuense TaxID=2763107 RepID=A0A7G8BQ72_9BACT|nr:DUF169 domain-containing protein [Alloacidobacterium dinghuense]QNI34692.1 DUF169 domain-containing protein [Alloacidobacterium dinghuense]
MSQNTNYVETAKNLANCLDLQQPPIAICFADSVPDGIDKHQGRVPAGCRFWQDAATEAFATSSGDHELCAIGVYTHHLQPSPAQQTDLMDALKVFAQLGYVREEDLPMIPALETQPSHVIYAPLSETALSPDVVLLFVNANQTLILSEAAQQVEHQNAPAMGRPACAIVPQVMNTGRAALSLGCCGARAYLDTLTDDVAIFAIPGAKLNAYTERIEALASANAVLSRFHQIRRRDVNAGLAPSIQDSLRAMESA